MADLGEWERLAATLDGDLRLIYPNMYLENHKLFDKIMGVGYLVRDLSDPEKGLDWVEEYQINKLLLKNPRVAVISKLLVVRLRLPWNEIDSEWLITEQNLNEHRDEYEVLEIFMKIRPKGSKEKAKWLREEDRPYFEKHRDNFEVVEKRYSVRWKWTEEDMSRLLDDSPVNTDNVHTYLAQ